IQSAYEVLKDKDKREAYERFGDQWEAALNAKKAGGYSWDDMSRGGGPGGPGGFGGGFGGGFEGGDYSDIFESMFGGRRGGFGGRRAPRDEEATIRLTLEDAFEGGVRHLTLNGRTVKVRIPAGVSDGKKIRLRGQASSGGDLLLNVVLNPHATFRAQDQDIHVDLALAPWEAALGAQVQVPTLGGKVGMKIPAGSQSGRKLRMKGRGLPGKTPGDQYVHLKIINPPTEGRAKELMEQMRDELEFDPRA
ncbi:MAG: DnaJ C-terminal domain-containing protein, partial [Gammaproteobacteria bacterium]